MGILYILLGLVFLVIGGEFLVRSAVGLSFKFNLSKMLVGLTVVSFATSAPELLVSLQAALDGLADISLGNVIGSNIANLGLVLGITALLGSLKVDRDFFRFNWPVMVLFSMALYLALLNDSVISRIEGIGLFVGLLVYLFVLIKRTRAKRITENEEIENATNVVPKTSYFKIILWLIIGAAGLYFGSELVISGATTLARMLGVGDYAIAVTVLAIGTSVPELAASVMAVIKKEEALSLGNLIGSNIFNIASVLGITAMITPIDVIDPLILSSNIFWLLGFAVVLLPLALIKPFKIFNRWKGLLLFGLYCVFISLTVLL
ncbi:calcium/sodium antiporter [Flavimarina sp. Hel_I_48]|uniref:calcium/sodium antiporter n=1 Tax=Flavimarina sp. Hel_I_48 TaxID=1392488 RepID=UPI0004DFC56F|nr:calcium/sodium antiporter [Flavimarina sp. Hel_I_48]